MAKARELKGRIRSVQNTRKITRTMEMVATSKLKRAQDRVAAARPYAERLGEVIGRLLTPELAARYPLLRQPTEVRRAAVLLLTSNRGLERGVQRQPHPRGAQPPPDLRARGTDVEAPRLRQEGDLLPSRFQGEALGNAVSDIGDRPGRGGCRAGSSNSLMEGFIAGSFRPRCTWCTPSSTPRSAPRPPRSSSSRAAAGRHRPRRRGGLRAGALGGRDPGPHPPQYVRNGV
jgi:F-type H+-transporting ATPase subunit gamma